MLITVDSDLSGGVVKIDVGVSKTPFDVHLELLCACSPYFENLFQHRFDQALTEPVICFPGDDPQVFAQVILWMYRGNDALELLECKKLDFLVRLWILASKLGMADLQNPVMLACKTKTDQKPTGILGQDTINYIYSHTLPQSPMRYLAVDIWVRRSTTEGFEKRQEELSRPFLEDLCVGLIKEREDLELPKSLPVVLEDRYFIRPSPLTDRNGEALPPRGRGTVELRCAATEAQMKSRKIKIPCSRTKDKAVTSTSASASSETGVDGQLDMTETSNKSDIGKQ
jgi:hypothetical protein